jgi:hypothetical protein
MEVGDSEVLQTGDPIFGSVQFGSELGSHPHWVPMLSGGETDVRNLGLGPDCIGFAASSPDFQLDWRGPTATLSFFFKAETPSEDTVLIVQGPNGQWHCNDDAHPDTLDPEVIVTRASVGPYYIWVASFNEGEYIDGQLGIAHRQ